MNECQRAARNAEGEGKSLRYWPAVFELLDVIFRLPDGGSVEKKRCLLYDVVLCCVFRFWYGNNVIFLYLE